MNLLKEFISYFLCISYINIPFSHIKNTIFYCYNKTLKDIFLQHAKQWRNIYYIQKWKSSLRHFVYLFITLIKIWILWILKKGGYMGDYGLASANNLWHYQPRNFTPENLHFEIYSYTGKLFYIVFLWFGLP